MDISFNYDPSAKAPDLNREGKFKDKKGRIHFYSYQGDNDKYAVAAKRIEGQKKVPSLKWYEKKYYILQKDPEKDLYYQINKSSLKHRIGITSEELSEVKDNNYVPLIQKKFEEIIKKDPLLSSVIKETPQKPKIEDAAATVFQKFLRSQKAREPVLPEHLTYDDYSKQVEKAETPLGKDMPQAPDGDTTVYLPVEMPEVVLKKSGRKEGVERFHQMQDVRKILNQMGCTHLVIPRANLYKGYLVETRLPINTGVLHNMSIYLGNPEKFDEAVREMTRLFSKVTLTDLVSSQKGQLLNDIVGDSVRYDNLPLYIDKDGKGKIGLIDLEHLNDKPSSDNLALLARIFPLHQEIILDEAQKLGLKIPTEEIQKASEKGKKYLNEGYTLHLQWLKEKGITPESALQKFNVSPERHKDIIQVIQSELLKMNQGENDVFQRRGFPKTPKNYKNFLTDNPEEVAKHLAPIIYKNILENINELVESHLNSLSTIDSESKMIESRMLSMDVLNTVTTGILPFRKFRAEIETPEMKMAEGMRDFKEETAARIGAVVMEELVRGGEIFNFVRDRISKQDATWLIRF